MRVFAPAVIMALSACAVPGPPTWPTQRQATRTARRTGLEPAPAWAREVMDALDEGHGERLLPQLAFRFRAPDAAAMFAAASGQLHALGPPRGIIESRVHREADREWFTALVVHGSGRARRLVLYQIARDEQDKLARILVRTHWFREQVTHPADAYLTVNRFRFPGRGEWVVIQGGRDPENNKHHGHRSQSYAYDVLIKEHGRSQPRATTTSEPNQSDPQNQPSDRHYAYGQPVLAPAPGVVVFARDGEPETRPGEQGHGGGNGVIIDHGFGEYSSLWHMIPGSAEVREGDHVEWGQAIGRVGNSGRSTQPHIHFHVACGPPGSDPFALPAQLRDLRVDGAFERAAMPHRRQRIEALEAHVTPGEPREGPTIILDW